MPLYQKYNYAKINISSNTLLIKNILPRINVWQKNYHKYIFIKIWIAKYLTLGKITVQKNTSTKPYLETRIS